MSRLFLIRHGQASLGKSNYDNLSDLGIQQSQILGEHFQDIAVSPDCIIRGDMQRHRQTMEGILAGMGATEKTPHIVTDARWNEFDFESLIKAYLDELGEAKPQLNSPKAFFALLRDALGAWSKDEIQTPLQETWRDFSERVSSALEDVFANREHENIFVVSSGGAISMALGHLLAFEAPSVIKLNLQTRNSGVSEVYFNDQTHYVCSFNGVPHLERGDRKHLITSA